MIADLERRLRDLVERIRSLESAGRPLAGDAYTAPTLLNSWANFGSGYNTAGYAKDPGGVVRLRGLISGGTATAGTVLFTLPVGYRPAARELFVVLSNNAIGRVDIETNGNVTIQIGSNVYLQLDGLTFRAA